MNQDKLPQQQNNDEIDLLVLFNYFGDKFNKLFRFIGNIFKSIFSAFIYASKALIDNIKIVVAVLIAALALGYGIEKFTPTVYESKMLVRTYFDVKYQLNTNLNYYNALLGDENYEQLERIFEIEKEKIETVRGFTLEPGPENENDKIQQYDEFLKSIDSVRASQLTFEQFIENRDIFSGNLFEISVESSKKDVFRDLEVGIYKSFDNLYSNEKKRKRDSMIQIRKENLINSLEEIDSLKKVYIRVLEEESQSAKASINLGGGFPLQQEKSSTQEYQLLNKEIEMRNELSKLDEEKVENDRFFEVLSGFQEIGNPISDPFRKYTYLLPILAFLLLCAYYLLSKFAHFVRNYNG